MYQQRVAPSDETTYEPRETWTGVVDGADVSAGEVEIRTSDWYVAVDDLAYGKIVLEAAPWPGVDERGRLAFGEAREMRTVPLAVAQGVVDDARGRAGQPTRALRIGDVFQVRGPELPDDVREWVIERDITRAAREAAKVALFSAVAPRLQPEEEQMLPAPPDAMDEDDTGGTTGDATDRAFPVL